MADTHRRIHSKGPYQQDEYDAGEAGIYPGMLVRVNGSGYVVKHDDEGEVCAFIIAAEDALQGQEVADVYTSGDPVTVVVPAKGGVVNVLVASGTNLAIGDKLTSGGDGTIIAADDVSSGVTANVLGACEEATDTLTGDTLIAMRVW